MSDEENSVDSLMSVTRATAYHVVHTWLFISYVLSVGYEYWFLLNT